LPPPSASEAAQSRPNTSPWPHRGNTLFGKPIERKLADAEQPSASPMMRSPLDQTSVSGAAKSPQSDDGGFLLQLTLTVKTQ
jgi:hypothetical protein